MTMCNACGLGLPARNQLAFLCGPCAARVPLPVLMRYRRAALAVHSFRRAAYPAGAPCPPNLVDQLARTWRVAADIARATLPRSKAA